MDVVGLVREEPMRAGWAGVDDAVRALGFAPHARGPHLHLAPPHRWPRPRLGLPGTGRVDFNG